MSRKQKFNYWKTGLQDMTELSTNYVIFTKFHWFQLHSQTICTTTCTVPCHHFLLNVGEIRRGSHFQGAKGCIQNSDKSMWFTSSRKMRIFARSVSLVLTLLNEEINVKLFSYCFFLYVPINVFFLLMFFCNCWLARLECGRSWVQPHIRSNQRLWNWYL